MIAFVFMFQFIELCRTATDNDTIVLKLLQKKYNQANRHFIWSDEFCKLIRTFSGRIRSDPGNKYVHIRDIVAELRRYKAKPMKNIKPLVHTVGFDSDQSTESDGCPSACKRLKMELVEKKKELSCLSVKRERAGSSSDVPSSLPSLLRLSSGACRFVPLSAMSGSTASTNVDISNCKLQVLGDDADSCSSFDDARFARPTESLVTTPEVEGNDTQLSANVANNAEDQAWSCDGELLEKPTDVGGKSSKKQSVKRTASVCGEQSSASSEVEKETTSTPSDNAAEPITHCSKDNQSEAVSDGSGKVKAKIASARQIRYLENLLSVCNSVLLFSY